MNKNEQDPGAGGMQSDAQPKAARLARQALEQSIAELPEGITERLAEARKTAVMAGNRPTVTSGWQFNSQYVWGIAASVLFTGVVWFFLSSEQLNNEQLMVEEETTTKKLQIIPSQTATPGSVNSAEDLLAAIELAELDPESMAMLEDLEFLYWLSLNDSDKGKDV